MIAATSSFWLREIHHNCSCGKRAVYELMNRSNAGLGYFCASCAHREVKKREAALAQKLQTTR